MGFPTKKDAGANDDLVPPTLVVRRNSTSADHPAKTVGGDLNETLPDFLRRRPINPRNKVAPEQLDRELTMQSGADQGLFDELSDGFKKDKEGGGTRGRLNDAPTIAL